MNYLLIFMIFTISLTIAIGTILLFKYMKGESLKRKLFLISIYSSFVILLNVVGYIFTTYPAFQFFNLR